MNLRNLTRSSVAVLTAIWKQTSTRSKTFMASRWMGAISPQTSPLARPWTAQAQAWHNCSVAMLLRRTRGRDPRMVMALITFDVPVTGFSFTWSNTSGAPRYQKIAVRDITFTPLPEMNPAALIWAVSGLAAAFFWRSPNRLGRSSSQTTHVAS
ncbi:MAG: hypothetical protein QOG67_2813 [Verrucomicrobiota bacterium]